MLCTCQSESWGRHIWQSLSDNRGDSDNSNSFQHHSDITNGKNINRLRGDSDS